MSRHLIVALTMALAVLALVAQAAFAQDEPENPLEPLDTSSPRAAYLSFIEHSEAVEEAVLEYRANRSNEARKATSSEVVRTSDLLDLSEVPAASQDEVVEGAFVAMADILQRIPPTDPETIPDSDMATADELVQWTLPGTEITFRPIKKGDRAGEWVLSPRTVAALPGWREEVEDLPVLVEDAAIRDWQRTFATATGPLIPGTIVNSLPDLAHETMLGSPLWKSVLAVLLAMLIVLVGALWYRFIAHRGPKDSVRRHLFGLTTPVLVIAMLELYDWFMSAQVSTSGLLAEMVILGTTIGLWIALAWLFRELVGLVLEWVIATPWISEASYDSHLLRLASRVISVLGIGLILLYGANEIGIPALGLLAGASVGALVVGLAAQSTVENLIGGMTLYADKPFEVGDYVSFGDDSGTVEDIGPRSTRIRKLNGTRLTVPNSDIVQARIANSTKRDNALFLHTIGLRYETTIEQIEWLVAHIKDGLRHHPKVEQDDDMPRVRLAAFGASSIDVEARAYVDTTSVHEFMAVQEELLAMIMRAVEAAGTSMAFPSTTAYLTRDEGIEGPGVLPPPVDTKESVPDSEVEGEGAGRDSAFESDDDD